MNSLGLQSNLRLQTETEAAVQEVSKNIEVQSYSAPVYYGDFAVSDGVLWNYKGDDIDVVIPDNLGITTIGENAFVDSPTIRSIAIPDGVTKFDTKAFFCCNALENINIPESVTEIGDYAFCATAIKSITIPGKVTRIGNETFSYCNNLTSVTLPDSIEVIGDSAFEGCNFLDDVDLPKNLKKIGAYAFYGTGWYKLQPGGLLYLDNWCVDFDGMPTDTITIKEGTIGIADSALHAFPYRDRLKKVNLPSSLLYIGDEVFFYCKSLESVNIPENLITVGQYAFGECALKEVTLPKSLTEIGENAFGTYHSGYPVPNFKIYCYQGTAGYNYALNHYFDYQLLDQTGSLVFYKNFAEGFTDKMTFNSVKALLNADIEIRNPSGKALSGNDPIGTGYKIKYGGAEYITVLKGDLSKDGVIDALDYYMLKKAILGNIPLDEAETKASRILDVEEVSSVDYMFLKRYVLKSVDMFNMT